jgi:hypothetical protein
MSTVPNFREHARLSLTISGGYFQPDEPRPYQIHFPYGEVIDTREFPLQKRYVLTEPIQLECDGYRLAIVSNLTGGDLQRVPTEAAADRIARSEVLIGRPEDSLRQRLRAATPGKPCGTTTAIWLDPGVSLWLYPADETAPPVVRVSLYPASDVPVQLTPAEAAGAIS